MKTFLVIFQIIVTIALMLLILSQTKGAGLSGVFGGEGGIYRTKRGFEKLLHYLTIIVSIVFFTTSLLIVLVG